MLQPSIHYIFGILAGGLASSLLLIPSSLNPVQAANLNLLTDSLQQPSFTLDTEDWLLLSEANSTETDNQNDLADSMALLFRLNDLPDEEVSPLDSEVSEYRLNLRLAAGSADKDQIADQINNCLAKASCASVKLNYSDISSYRGTTDNALDSHLLMVHKANQRQNGIDYDKYAQSNLTYHVLSSLGAKSSNSNNTPSNAASSNRSNSASSSSSTPSKPGEKLAQSSERSMDSQSTNSESSDAVKNFAAQADYIQPATKPEEWPLPLILIAAGAGLCVIRFAIKYLLPQR